MHPAAGKKELIFANVVSYPCNMEPAQARTRSTHTRKVGRRTSRGAHGYLERRDG